MKRQFLVVAITANWPYLKVKPSKVNEIVHEIANKAIGCRTLFDANNYVHTPFQCPKFRIPDGFPSLEEAQFMCQAILLFRYQKVWRLFDIMAIQ